MSGPHLELLDGLLGPGVAGLSETFRHSQEQYVVGRQCPDGGFPGRQGGADPYYTDFAVRTLDLVGLPAPTAHRVAGYLANLPPPRDVLECFGALNCARLLARHGVAVAVDREGVARVVASQAASGGGLARPGQSTVSAYHTFLGALCCQLAELASPAVAAAGAAVSGLQTAEGGFAEQPGEGHAQTNATAAAVGLLLLCDALTAEQAAAASAFLIPMQAADGGLRAHARAPGGDLLATFTGLVTLALIDDVCRLDLPLLARFVRAVAEAEGGFRAWPGDHGADVEYTYYGIGCLALLRVVRDTSR